MPELTSAERRALRARAHHLHPVIMIGDDGLTPGVIREIDIALRSHELIKIRVLGDDRAARGSMMDQMCTALDASPVQRVGKILVIFRPRPEHAGEHPQARPKGRKRKYRPKRRFQDR